MKIRAHKLLSIITVVFALVAGVTYAKSALELFDSGLAEQNDENWYSATEYFMEAVKLNPAFSDAWAHLAQCSYELDEYDLALTQLDEAEKYSQNDDALQSLRGLIYITQYKFDDARAIFNAILKRTPNNIDARFGLAELDLFNGKISGAQKQYLEALKRSPKNRKALLSLAVIACQMGKYDTALRYINESINSYSGEKEVHYLAAVVHSMKGDLVSAENTCRVAIQIALDANKDYERATELLSKILFMMARYDECIALCDERIEKDRKSMSAWYLKGTAQKAQGKINDAITTWDKALLIQKDDEVMRAALEVLINDAVPLADNRRSQWAKYHTDCALQCERRYDKSGASYEWQRALKIEPTNDDARASYAKMLKLNGMNELYLEQLLFIRANKNELMTEEQKKNPSYKDLLMSDTIEAYTDLLQDTLAKKWKVEPFYLDKTRWSLGIYYYEDIANSPASVTQLHIQNNLVSSAFAADLFSGIATTAVRAYPLPIKSFGDAYNKARNSGLDYFLTLNLDEGERDLTLSYSMYSAKTGNAVTNNSFYAMGNNRYTNVFRRFQEDVQNKLVTRAKILAREGKTLLCDIGKSEGALVGDVFDIVKANTLQTATSGLGVSYKKENTLGTFTIEKVGEEVSEGSLATKGFYDKVNIGDDVVLLTRAKDTPADATTPSPAPRATTTTTDQKDAIKLLETDITSRHVPSFIDLIRSIY